MEGSCTCKDKVCTMNIGFIGAGKVGTSLGKLFANGGLQVTGYFDQHQESARFASDFTGSSTHGTLASICDASNVLFLTVPDGIIPTVHQQLLDFDLRGKQIIHCSGSLTVDECFPNIDQAGAVGLSIHPLFPVASATESWQPLQNAWFSLEGEDPAALEQWRSILTGLGLKVQTISGESKARYHAACVFSSNLMCALVAESVDLLSTCGFEPQNALSALEPLIRSNVENILSQGPVQALTGPVERGDVVTVAKNAAALPFPEEYGFYAAASHRLLSVAREKHPQRDYAPLQSLIDEQLIKVASAITKATHNPSTERTCNA